MLFIHETFLAYKFETLKNCKKLKHIMIMNIPLIYIFSSYVIFDQQLKITLISKPFSWKTLSLPPPPEKIHSPLFTHYPPKNSKSAGTPFLLTLKIFQPPPHLQKGGEGGGHYESYESSNVPLNFTLYCKIH